MLDEEKHKSITKETDIMGLRGITKSMAALQISKTDSFYSNTVSCPFFPERSLFHILPISM